MGVISLAQILVLVMLGILPIRSDHVVKDSFAAISTTSSPPATDLLSCTSSKSSLSSGRFTRTCTLGGDNRGLVRLIAQPRSHTSTGIPYRLLSITITTSPPPLLPSSPSPLYLLLDLLPSGPPLSTIDISAFDSSPPLASIRRSGRC